MSEDRWRWKVDGHLYGPVTTSELHLILRHGKIPDEARLQLVGTGDWLTAVEVKESFGPLDEESTSEAASAALARAHKARLTSTGEAPPLSEVGARRIGKAIAAIRSFFDDFGGWMGSGIDAIFGLRRLFNRKLTLAALVLVLAGVIVQQLIAFRQTGTFERLNAAAQQVRQMRRGPDAEKNLRAFAAQTLPWLSPEVERLGKAAKREALNQDSSLTWLQDHALTTRYLHFSARNLQSLLTATDPVQSVEFEKQLGENLRLAQFCIEGAPERVRPR